MKCMNCGNETENMICDFCGFDFTQTDKFLKGAQRVAREVLTDSTLVKFEALIAITMMLAKTVDGNIMLERLVKAKVKEGKLSNGQVLRKIDLKLSGITDKDIRKDILSLMVNLCKEYKREKLDGYVDTAMNILIQEPNFREKYEKGVQKFINKLREKEIKEEIKKLKEIIKK